MGECVYAPSFSLNVVTVTKYLKGSGLTAASYIAAGQQASTAGPSWATI